MTSPSAPELGLVLQERRADLQSFLREEWSRNHVFVRRADLLDWQHLDAEKGAYNFVEGRAGDAIQGILGFISCSRFDPALEPWRELFLSIWKISERDAARGTGMVLYNKLRQLKRPAFIGAIGLSDMVEPIYRALGYTQGRLDHHVFVNPQAAEYRILGNAELALGRQRPLGKDVDVDLQRLDLDELLALRHEAAPLFADVIPHKSVIYLANRYVRHPWFDYEVYALRLCNTLAGIVVFRPVRANGALALRIVDLIGCQHAVPALVQALQGIAVSRQAEYVDMISHGMDACALADAGMVDRHDTQSLIVPNYFEPFVPENKDLTFAYKVFRKDLPCQVRLFRGDSDQDRPNLLPEY